MVMILTYLEEILEQPKIIGNIPSQFDASIFKDIENLKNQIDQKNIDQIIITGMGGSLYSSYPLYIFLNTHIDLPINIWDCSELLQQAKNIITNKTIIIATSQSGESIELVRLTELKQKPKISISITNIKNNTLSNWSDISIFTNAGSESTVSSKTYTSGCAVHYILGCALIKKKDRAITEIKYISEKIESCFDSWKKNINSLAEFLEPINNLTFIGRGISYSSANYAALITAEASKLPSIGLSGGQFRHGPIELVNDVFSCVIFLGSQKNASLNIKLSNDIAKLGGKCLLLGCENIEIEESANIKILKFPIIEENLFPIVEVIPLQLIQIPFSKKRGFEAGKFNNASKVTIIE